MKRTMLRTAAACLALLLLSACSREPEAARTTAQITIDGSSTLGPLVDIAKDLYKQRRPDVAVQVATSGTSNGFKRFLADDAGQRIDISKASRPIAPQEVERAAALGIEYIELPVALDGIAVVVHPSNTFCDHLTDQELRAIWSPDSKINNWKDVRASFPDLPLKLFGAGPQSGTFDVFTEVVNGKVKQSRRDYIASESDNQLVIGVSEEEGSLGYFGYSYYVTNRDKLRALPIAWNGKPPVEPTAETIRDGSYALARPTFLYVSTTAAQRPEVADFLKFILTNPSEIVEHERVRSVSLSGDLYAAAIERLTKPVTGTVFTTPEAATKPLSQLYLAKP